MRPARRNTQGRARATVADFLAGLMSKGDLTRFVLDGLDRDPDEAYRPVVRLQRRGRRPPRASLHRRPE